MAENTERCVVTGLGLITAIGNNVNESWENAVQGISGIKKTTTLNTDNCYTSLSAEVNDNTLSETYNDKAFDRVSQLCLKASSEAMNDAGLKDFDGSVKASVIMGSCVGGVSSAEHYYRNNKDESDVNKIAISPIANHVAKQFHAGGVVTNIANACAAGTISIAYACDLIRSGKADVVIAGGADAFASVPFAGFLSLHALDEKPCSPFNRCRGITLGEGSGAIIIESYEHAVKRKAKIYCEVIGSGISSDAHHITAPRPNGKGQMYAISHAMKNAGISPEEISYINAHGTGTAKNDEAEFLSLHTIFDEHNSNLSVSSTKAMVGHCLGAAGAIEAVFSIKALTEGIVPPTIGYTEKQLEQLSEKAGNIDFCPNTARKKGMTAVMSNSFAFGGNNASVIFAKESKNNGKHTEKQRLFITGLGIVTPVGNGKENYIDKIKNQEIFDGISVKSKIDREDYEKCGFQMAFYRKLDRFAQLQAVSGKYALIDAGLDITEENATDVGIVVGTADGPLSTVCEYQQDILKKGNCSGSAFKFPNTVYNAAGGYLSICTGIQGYNVTLTNGIQSGLASIAYGINIIRNNQAKTVLACGTDENSEIMTELYLKTGCFNEINQDGFRLSDGSCTLVLENENSVINRNAEVYAEVLGYGMACMPVAYGGIEGSDKGLFNAINSAVSDSDISISDIDGIIGFSNGIPEVDNLEQSILKTMFDDRLDAVPMFNIHDVIGEGRAAGSALSAAHGALLLSGKLGKEVYSVNIGKISIDKLNKLLVISYGTGGVYCAVILSKTMNGGTI